MTKWFRFYADAMRNPKVAALSDREFRLWVRLLSVASENEGRIPAAEELKRVLNARLDHLLTGLERLLSGGLIDRLDGGYEPHNWGKFQYKSDTSTERVAKHRATRNVSVTRPDTETEQKQKIEPIAQQPITAAPRKKIPDLVDRLAEAAGMRGNLSTGLAFAGEILGLLDAGYDLERDVLPAIKAKPNPNARSWSYFVPQIRDAVARRSAVASVPKPTAPTFDWSAALDVYRSGTPWPHGWGPEPGTPGCRVPADLLVNFHRERAA